MTSTGQTDADARADAGPAGVRAVTAAVESARFVRLVARPDGDSLAAAGLLARAMSDRGTPFQVSVEPTVAGRSAKATGDGDGAPGEQPHGDAASAPDGAANAADGAASATVVIGACDADVPVIDPVADERPASLAACEVVRALGQSVDAVLALAGAFAAGVDPDASETEWLLDAARERETIAANRRPGVAVPTTDVVDGLAHSGLVTASWSGDVEATRESVVASATRRPDTDGGEEREAETESDGDEGGDPDAFDSMPTDDDARRRIGSLVALDAVGVAEASEAAASAIGRVLRPHEIAGDDASFATVGGYADVLDATAREKSGTCVALAMGHGGRADALDAWRTHGRTVHETIRGASVGRYDGFCVFDDARNRSDAADAAPRPEASALETVARLAVDYRSPEPIALVLGADAAGIATVRDGPAIGPLVERLARAVDADYDAGRRVGSVRYDSDTDSETVLDAAREVFGR